VNRVNETNKAKIKEIFDVLILLSEKRMMRILFNEDIWLEINTRAVKLTKKIGEYKYYIEIYPKSKNDTKSCNFRLMYKKLKDEYKDMNQFILMLNEKLIEFI
jgi:uncharacterized protein YrrD